MEVMRRVSAGVNLADLGVRILLEMESDEKAVLLKGKIRKVVSGAATVRRPERKTPVLILDVPDWVEADEVAGGMAGLDVPPDELAVDGKNQTAVTAWLGLMSSSPQL